MCASWRISNANQADQCRCRPGWQHIASPDESIAAYRATPASCLCISAAAVASFAESRDSPARRSWWRRLRDAGAAIRLRHATCSLTSAVSRLASVTRYFFEGAVVVGFPRWPPSR